MRLEWQGTGIADEDVEAVLSSDSGAVWRRSTDPPGVYRNLTEWPLKQE